MKEVRHFNSGECYGIKVNARNHCGSMTVVVRQYNAASHGFECSLFSSEGVIGQYQPLRFETEEEANRYIQEHSEDLTRGDFGLIGDLYASRSRAAYDMIKIPLADTEQTGWVVTRKFSADRMQRLAQECPEYFSEEEVHHYRGFTF